MKITFKDCLEKRRIFRFEPAKRLVDLELEDANSDYLSAKEELVKDGFKWATIKGYYAMYIQRERFFIPLDTVKKGITAYTLQ